MRTSLNGTRFFFQLFLLSTLSLVSCAQETAETYLKIERMLPMRDGVKLYTAIYIPKDSVQKHAFLLQRTPYSCMPYGEKNIRKKLGPNALFKKEPYIYVYQDVRGRYASEGNFEEMTPAIDQKLSSKDVDESSDTYDTIDWLIKNISGNNGKVGMYGISYPGFYATASLPGAHPALVAVSPQAPVTDEFEGDDAYHRGAFFLMDNFSFLNFFDAPRPGPRQQNPPVTNKIKIDDAYDFYLKMGALSNFNATYFDNKSKIWNEYLEHNTNDSYWKARNIRTHLTNIKPATLVVGGWFDAEDLFGALNTYRAIEQQNPVNNNRLVMGPWTHGAWESADWNKFDNYTFNSNTSAHFQQMELDFFNYYLLGKGSFDAGEASIFITGSNEWKTFAQWPPKEATPVKWMLNEKHGLLLSEGKTKGLDSYTSNPADPVPYLDKQSDDRLSEYMSADQTFAAKRADVVYYESTVLEKDITLCGPVTASLSVSLSGTDADFIVKVIDVWPGAAGIQQLVRAEVLRGKFRNSFEKPETFVPNTVTPVKLTLNDVAHSFKAGHKIMVQVQSSWFPLVDRNPQQFMDIGKANDSDFKKATVTIYHDEKHPSFISCLQVKD